MLEVQDIQERWIDQKVEYDQMEREAEEEQARIQEEQAMEMEDSQPPAPTGGMDPDFGDMTVPKDSGIKVVRKQ
jgi:hypothetical protein